MGNTQRGQEKRQGKSPLPYVIGAVVLIIVVLALAGKLLFYGGEKGKSFLLTGKETRPVLDPTMFTGMTRAAYEAAQQYPEALNEVFCYCYCDQSPFHHKSLLSCFVDKHGAG